MAKGKRKEAEAHWLTFVKEFEDTCLKGYLKDDGGDKTKNSLLYQDLFSKITDDEFHSFMLRIREKDFVFPILVPNMDENRIDPDAVMALGRKYGVEFHQQLILVDPITDEVYKTAVKHLVVDLPVRRQSQHLEKKISTNENNRKVDILTGQATGDSKSASISQPELSALLSKGNINSAIELVKVRGGDKKAYDLMNKQLRETGGFSLETIIDLNTRPKVTETLKMILLAGCHIDSTLTDD